MVGTDTRRDGSGLLGWYRRLTDRETERTIPNSAVGGRRIMEAAPAITTEDWFWGRVGTTGTEEDYFWRRLSDNWTQKDVLPATYLEIHNQVYEAYNANPMANAIVEMGVNFTLGDGLQIDAKHKKVQKLIDDFWNDPDNHMAIRQFDLATELSLYGELFVRIFVNPFSGHVKLGQIDPSLIDDIECDPENIEHQLRCHRRPLGQQMSATAANSTGAAPGDAAGRSLRPGGGPTHEGRGYPGPPYDGVSSDNTTAVRWMDGVWYEIPDEVMHFTINKVTNAKRGKSDLATLLPWLRRYKDWLIDRVRINKYKAAFLWDVKLTGADRQTIQQKLDAYARPPEPGSVLVHNESEEWSAIQPMIDAGSVAADGEAIKLMVAMGAGLPEHYLADGGDVNRATASEMSLPTLKRFQRRQDYLKFVFGSLIDRVIQEAQTAGTLPRTIDTSYEIRFPRLEPDESKNIGFAAFYMARALQLAQQMGLVSQETARKMFFDAAYEETDLGREMDRIAQELADPSSILSAIHPAALAAAGEVRNEKRGVRGSRSSLLSPRSSPTDPASGERPTHAEGRV